MARPLRVELSGGLYHVTSRGDGREAIYCSDADRLLWLEVFGEVCRRFNWVCHAWCQMTNHYHVVVETPEGNLSAGMRQLNGVYTQRFNRVHGRVGHVFQGRFKAILVEQDAYLLELARYVVLNPVRAGMVERVDEWRWSSYAAMCAAETAPPWLQTDWLLSQFGTDRAQAIAGYAEFVQRGLGQSSIWAQLKGQIYLGSPEFVSRMQAHIERQPTIAEIPRAQRRGLLLSLEEYASRYPRNEAMARAYLSGHHTQQAIALHFGLHYTTVSRLIKAYEQERQN